MREYSVRLNLNMTKTLAFLIKKVNFAFFERVCTKLDSKLQPSDYKSDAIPLDQGGFVEKDAVLQVLYYVRAESMKLLPSRRGPPVARRVVFGVSDVHIKVKKTSFPNKSSLV